MTPIPFFKDKSEDEATQTVALWAVVVITIGLAIFNVSGAIGSSSGEGALWIVRIVFGLVIAGAEVLAAVALVRVMLAPNRLRKVVGFVLLVALAWACVQNGKKGGHLIWPDYFTEDPRTLDAKAELYDAEALALTERATVAAAGSAAELTRVRSRIAAIEGEQALMSAQSPEKIREAQSLLISKGKYFGQVDGIRERLTEAAMRGYGEEVSRELETLRTLEQNMMAGLASPAQSQASAKAVERIEAEAKARRAREMGFWLEVMLWVLEGARSFGLWVFVTKTTAKGTTRRDQLNEEIEMAHLERRLREAKGESTPAPEPVAAAASAAPVTPAPTVDPPEPTPGRKGGLAAQSKRRVGEIKIPVEALPKHQDEAFALKEAAE